MGKKSLIALGSALVGLEAYNRRVTMPVGELEGQLPVPPVRWPWRFGEIAVYETGDPHNPPLLLLHGQNAAASAAEMKEPFARLSDRFHIFAPDLLGYGLSERPDIPYTPQLYIELIGDLLREVVKRPAAVLASSLTSAYAVEAAVADPEWITSLVLVCPTGVRTLQEQSAGGKVIEALLRLPVLGQGMFNGIASRRSIRYFLEGQTYHDKSLVTSDMVEQKYRTAHVPGARHAPSAFVSGKLYWDTSEAWSQLSQNVLLVWGREAKITPLTDAAAFIATNPGAELQEISPAGILPHDEQPEQFANLVGGWLERISEARV